MSARKVTKMNLRSKEIALLAMEHHARFSEQDGCYVVSRTCAMCGNVFSEELETAKVHVITGVTPVCLSCDHTADCRERATWLIPFIVASSMFSE